MISSNIMIHRSRLTDLAEAMGQCRILYVQAPAGYGKTIFAAQWLDSRKGPSGMITIDEYDNTPADICCKLKKALEAMCTEEFPETVTAYTRHPGFTKAPVEFLMRAAITLPGNLTANLVIDDLHYLTDLSAQKLLKDFILRLPSGIRICILSRSSLPEAFSGLVLKNQIQFIPQEQLLFDNREICELYKNKSLAITPAEADEILRLTEGWPIGINALLLSASHMPDKNLSPHWLESFLKTQVWEIWDDRIKKFMLGTCIEEELSEEICCALTGEKDSLGFLEELVTKGAFLYKQEGHTYRFHRLFREFLRKLFLDMPPEYREGQIQKSGKWYLAHKDFYHAVERFSYIKDYEHIARCFDLLEEMDRAGFDAEQVMLAVRSTLDENILVRYPHLYFMMAFTARNEGQIEDFKIYADNYYRNYPKIAERNPELAHNIFFLYSMDFRITLKEIAKAASEAQFSGMFQGVRGSATLYLPFYHKSYRDFSELLPGDIDESVMSLGQILGPLLGSECTMVLDCIRGGLYYEQGNMQRAQELAVCAVTELQDGFAPESNFCAMMLLLAVTHAMKQPEQEALIQKDIQKMIDKDKALYLQFNFDAAVCRNQMGSGDTEAARRWLESRGTEVYGPLDFYRLYGHFTTAEAYIVLEDYSHSIILLEKLLEMCKAMKRTADIIEAEILLAVSYWKKKRGSHKQALSCLEEAVLTAQPIGYEQAFISHGANLKNILSSLKNWTMRSDYTGPLSPTFVRKLYIGAAEQDSCSTITKNERKEPEIKLTQKQKKVARLMCQGYSYRKIAEELGVQFSTVRSHIELIYRKLDAGSMDEAIQIIRRLHLLDEP
ncbi:MAG: LuxR C-terminal-related transcriptional regulator [Eubacteriales bacterium]|nr:LuxR C-terminal-related transcriptional regulator [Eubacteriales bacterium]